MKKIVVLNATLRGSAHEIVDASFIVCLSRCFEKILVFFRRDRSQYFEKNILFENVDFLPLRDSCTRGLKHEFFSSILEIWVLLKNVRKDDICLSTYVNTFSCHVLNFISKVTGKKLYICCHSELRVVAEPNISIKKIWKYSLKRFFTKTKFSKNLKLIVLGDSIYKNLIPFIDSNRMNAFVPFDHPYFALKNVDNAEVDDSSIRIGVIGYLSPAKERGFDNVLRLAKLIENKRNLKLVVVSRISQDLAGLLPETVELCSRDGNFLPRNRYDAEIEKLKYIYVPYPKESFKFTASGALLEAIFRNKPVLYHGNDYARYIERKFGQYGICLDDLNLGAIETILANESMYESLLSSQKKVQNALLPETLCSSLRKIFE